MRKLVFLVLVMAMVASLFATGCTVTESQETRNRRHKLINDLQLRMLVEDWDYFWLYEQNSALNRWHPWVGI